MAAGTYSTGALALALRSLENEPNTVLRDRYFPSTNEIQFETEEIFFDLEDRIRRVAPYVSPLVEGVVMEHRGFSTRSVKPAYMKPKGVIDPNDLFQRTFGEPISGNLSLQARRDRRVAQILMDHRDGIDMAEEVQASEALRLGQVTITGKGYGTDVVSFNRAAALTVTLAGGDLWDSGTGTPLDDLEAWALLIRQNSNAIAREVVMAADSFSAFKGALTSDQLRSLLDFRRGSETTFEVGPRTAEKVRFEGQVGGFFIWTYSDSYQDAAGVTQEVMPSGSVLMVSGDVEGTPIYGAIRDVRALVAMRRFSKTWIEEDPSGEYLMTQSAPLMVPVRANASLGATVL